MIFGFDRTEVQPAEAQQSNQTSCGTVDQILTVMHVFVLLLTEKRMMMKKKLNFFAVVQAFH